ncbi:MAG: YajQ family cyclic di-GMP-binding protein [Chloroflexota bacterium]|nr:YajQ family cyclic di-GMP-binding protein [Chloroflexota bacterium]
MSDTFSFDVVSDFDRQELVNVVDQSSREINARYDLKDSKTEMELDGSKITINTDSEYHLDAIKDILQSKAVKRNLSLKIFKFGKAESASGGRYRQVIELQKGLSDEIAKSLVKELKSTFPKVQAQIQGDALRVTAKSKDELQRVIAHLKGKENDLPVALQYTNYR